MLKMSFTSMTMSGLNDEVIETFLLAINEFYEYYSDEIIYSFIIIKGSMPIPGDNIILSQVRNQNNRLVYNGIIFKLSEEYFIRDL